MEKKISLSGLTCPNCSAKIEREAGHLEGVSQVSINLIQQTLTAQVEDAHAADFLPRLEALVHSHEPHVQVSELGQSVKMDDSEQGARQKDRRHILRLVGGALVYAAGLLALYVSPLPQPVGLAVLIAAYAILGADVVLRAAKNIAKGQIFDENFLMSLSTIGAFAIGEYPEAVAVMLFYQIGEFFQDLAVKRSHRSISDLMDVRPDSAAVSRHREWVVVPPETVCVDERILVKPGEKIPLDGVVEEGSSTLDTRALTGESAPKDVQPGDTVLSGCINQSGALTIRVTRAYHDSTVAKIIDLVEHAASRKAPTEHFITTFARYYTPVVVILAALLAVVPPLVLGDGFAQWLHRSFVFLVISCPCALVISIPLTFFGGLGAASRHGVLIKGSNYLEALNKVDIAVFDKTGTLTKGVFRVTQVLPAEGHTREELLSLAAAAESMSNHPIARSIVAAWDESVEADRLSDYREIAGLGVEATVDGASLLVGNRKLMDSYQILCPEIGNTGTTVHVAAEGSYLGCILISDELKEDSKAAIAALKAAGVKRTVMLTGDNEETAQAVAQELDLDHFHAQLLPQEKVELMERLAAEKTAGGKLLFVGDGINDAPVLACSDIGVAMGGLGSDAAIEAADVVLMTDEPSKLLDAIQVAGATRAIVMQNIVFALGVKVLFLILGATGDAGMWEAVFSDVGVMVLAVLNAMRILKK